MKIAAIDIGTNTCLLLVAEVGRDGTVQTLHQEQRLPRLGRSVDRDNLIDPGIFPLIASILIEYKCISAKHGAETLVACATSAVRDASNQRVFLDEIERLSGIRVEVLSGEAEALLTYKGAIGGLPALQGSIMVLDIGGGSTELSHPVPGTHNGSTRLTHYSFQIGAVRLTERFFRHSPPARSELASARALILEELAPVRNPGFERYTLVGVAGTVTTLACLDQELASFDPSRVRGYLLPYERVARWLGRLATLSSEQIEGLSSAARGRADILTAGTLILHEIMSIYRIGSVMTSDRGLRYGVVLREWERTK